MSVPNVDTFEHDIAEEIKTKEASITDIASAGGDIKNATPAQTSNLLVLLGLVFVVLVIGGVGYLLYLEVKPTVPVQTSATGTSTPRSPMVGTLSATLSEAVGSSLGSVTKSDYGYAVQVVSYSNVFSYMLRNESQFADELARAVGSPRDTTGTTSVPFEFADMTLSNQNMRVGTSGSSTIVYGFVNTNTLLISSSTSGLLQLRGGILTQ